ncbi:MAG: hypothetical protein Q7K65_05285, partial [Candidatus Buchananbacteria bacterium]|nr:hypothetical protein [Candidatus Buchananbacteria bacterium]
MQKYKSLYITLAIIGAFLVANPALSYSRSPSGNSISGDLITITTASNDTPLRTSTTLQFYSSVCYPGYAEEYLILLDT